MLNVAVIGAGVIGVCSAIYLQRDGHQVTLIDPEQPGTGASFGNAGCFNGSSIIPMSMPGVIWKVPGFFLDTYGPLAIRLSYLPTITPWLAKFIKAGRGDRVQRQARALRQLTEPGLRLMRELAEDAGAGDLVKHTGHLYVYRTETGFAGDQLGWQIRRDNGVSFEILDADGLRAREPSLSPRFIKGVSIPENGFTINPGNLVRRLAEAFVRRGGSIVKAQTLDFRFDGPRLTAVVTDTGCIKADFAVVAAGARSAQLAEKLGNRIPLDTERGYHCVVAESGIELNQPVTDAEGKFVATPMETGLRFAGTVEFAGLEARPNWQRAHMLLKQAQDMIPRLPRRTGQEHRVWMGFRPSLPDSLPVIGPSKRSACVVYAFGHGHIGMTTGPVTGQLVSDLVSGRPSRIDYLPFSSERF